jgi:hypothetical protein
VEIIASVLVISLATVLLLNAIPAAYGYVSSKTYKLFADGYVSSTARITCWQHGKGEAKVDIRIDVMKAFHGKGRKILSAYVIDVSKNGPESYLPIGKPMFPKDKYDYARFSAQFSAKQFPAMDGSKPCPIDSIGRLVVVTGTTPPLDSHTLSQGTVDIVAATTKDIAQKGLL